MMLKNEDFQSVSSSCTVRFLYLADKALLDATWAQTQQALPDAKRSFTNTRNFSSVTWASVMRNTVPIFFTPALMYNAAKSL